jgi:hypothetical protein
VAVPHGALSLEGEADVIAGASGEAQGGEGGRMTDQVTLPNLLSIAGLMLISLGLPRVVSLSAGLWLLICAAWIAWG